MELGAETLEDAGLPLPSGDTWLLPNEDRLWLVSSESMGYFQDGGITREAPDRKLGEISRPFFHSGAPAVVEESPEGFTLLTYTDGDWQEVGTLSLEREKRFSVDELQIVESGGKHHCFWRLGESLYYREGVPLNEEERGGWDLVSKVSRNWVAVSIDGELVVFYRESDEPQGDIIGLERSNGAWIRFFTQPAVFAVDLEAFSMPGGRFGLVIVGFPGSTRVLEVSEGEVVRTTRYGRGFPFPAGMMSMAFIPHIATAVFPLLLAIILSVQMKNHRITDFVAAEKRAAFAPLWRRALAQLVDAVVLMAPVAVVVGLFMKSFTEMEDLFFFSNPLWIFAGILLSMCWAVLGLVVFSFLEGLWGVTPGKWLVGIRVVGIDLLPCGFGRGLIRNALKFVDGFFNYMVGILIVALTENWQRVGDLAARTVVVMADEKKPRSLNNS
jgi:uncharacterized RDD family membrane protein YckC